MNKINLMEAFAAVYEEGSYTAASKRLGKTKALVSQQISQLEDYLQVRLVTRSTRSIKITTAGEGYYHHIKQVLDDIANVESRLRDDLHTISGRLRLSAPTTFGELVMSPFIAQLVQEHPKLQIDLMLNDRYVDIVNEGFDAAVRIGKLEDSSLVASYIGTTTLQVCAAPAFIHEYGAPQALQELADFPCIFDSNYRKSYWQFETPEGTQRIEPKPYIRVNSALAAANIAKNGQGICYCPNFAVDSFIRNGELALLFEECHTTSYPIHVVYPHRKFLSARVSVFIEALKYCLSGS